MPEARGSWPALPLEDWQETYGTLHMYTQVVGKIRLKLSPMLNQWCQAPLYVTALGLTTSRMRTRIVPSRSTWTCSITSS